MTIASQGSRDSEAADPISVTVVEARTFPVKGWGFDLEERLTATEMTSPSSEIRLVGENRRIRREQFESAGMQSRSRPTQGEQMPVELERALGIAELCFDVHGLGVGVGREPRVFGSGKAASGIPLHGSAAAIASQSGDTPPERVLLQLRSNGQISHAQFVAVVQRGRSA